MGAREGSHRRQRMAAPDRREAILDAAEALFTARGWDRVTIADVLGAAGISKGGFYHHFTARDDLLAGIVARMTDRALAAARTARDRSGGDALARLNAFIAGSLRWTADNPDASRLQAEILSRSGNEILFQRVFDATSALVRPALAEMIAEGVEEGSFDVADPALTAEVIVGLAQGRRSALARALGEASAGRPEAGATVLEARMVAEGMICDRLLGVAQGSVALSSPTEYRRIFAGLAAAPAGADVIDGAPIPPRRA